MSRPLGARAPAVLSDDARNRALRTFLQGLAIDVAVAVAVLVHAVSTQNEPVVWQVAAASLARTVAQTIAAYVMRRWLDPSRFPTPLPPASPGPPAGDETGLGKGLSA